MNVVVLAGGYAKRMWPLTKNIPKHLLSIAGKPMLQYVLEKVEDVVDVNKIYVSTNAKFKNHFEEFFRHYRGKKDIQLVIENTFSESKKHGSLGALGFLIEQIQIDDELLIIGGDNLFLFSLNELVKFYREKQSDVIALYDVSSLEMAKRYGIVSIDENYKITDFQEKVEKPKSSLVATACYILSKQDVWNLLRYLKEGNNPDAMGNFIMWLHKKTRVYGYVFKGKGRWFDIGSFESYKNANKFYESQKAKNLNITHITRKGYKINAQCGSAAEYGSSILSLDFWVPS